jgi:hypothetical protein
MTDDIPDKFVTLDYYSRRYRDGLHPCDHCGRRVPLEDFRRGERWSHWCHECHAERTREWRAANPEYLKAYNEARRTPPTELVCSECSEGFLGRPNKLTCSRKCKDARYRRLHPDEYQAKRQRIDARHRARVRESV